MITISTGGQPSDDIIIDGVIETLANNRLDDFAIVSLVNNFPDSLKRDYKIPKYCINGKFLLCGLFCSQ